MGGNDRDGFGTQSNSCDSETLGNASFVVEIKEDMLTMGKAHRSL